MFTRRLQVPAQSFFVFGPRGTGKGRCSAHDNDRSLPDAIVLRFGVTDKTHSAALPFRLDRTAFSVVTLEAQDDDGEYWHDRSPVERLAALEYLRRMAYGPAATARLQRVLAVARLGAD
jgi:hypothetical protein